jgi:hypothetical protein
MVATTGFVAEKSLSMMPVNAAEHSSIWPISSMMITSAVLRACSMAGIAMRSNAVTSMW